MGRGRVELKRIENKINRQVTFAKRRNGLLKKAYELSVLCDAEVALIIFSNRGKLYEFCSSPSMLKTLEKYQTSNYGAPDHNTVSSREALEISSQQEYLKLKARFETLQRQNRNLQGEDLGSLSSKDLEALERQLDMTLKQIRAMRTQFMVDELTKLQKQLIEASQANSLQWNMHDVGYDRQPAQTHEDAFFHPLECEPTLHIGYQPDPVVVAAAAAAAAAGAGGANCVNNFLPNWLP
ncbi:unnamed protein product [Amaranthus hypochondriacus]